LNETSQSEKFQGAGLTVRNDQVISGDGYAATDEDIMDNVSNMGRESDRDETLHGWQSPKSKKKKKKKTRQVVVAPRVSQRIPRDGIPIAEKGSMRA
jgi:hypothetical protein